MPTAQELCESIADTIKDYRAGEVPKPAHAHVARWIGQFPQNDQFDVLTHMNDLLATSYINRADMEDFLSGLVTHKNLAGNDPKTFWPTVNFLDIQGGGSSQHDILEMFASTLKKTLGITLSKCGSQGDPFVYLDDVSFSGMRVKSDVCDWIAKTAPAAAVVHVIVGALHTGGYWYANKQIAEAAAAAKKKIDVHWWRVLELEDRSNYSDTSDIFKPSSLPQMPTMNAYLAGLKFPPPLRTAGQMGQCKMFKTEAGRHLLEQQFLQAGLHIRSVATNLPATQRLLGYASTNSRRTLGFGSTVVTFRNCPNNCPLALWVGAPWYPLFPRKTNTMKFDFDVF